MPHQYTVDPTTYLANTLKRSTVATGPLAGSQPSLQLKLKATGTCVSETSHPFTSSSQDRGLPSVCPTYAVPFTDTGASPLLWRLDSNLT